MRRGLFKTIIGLLVAAAAALTLLGCGGGGSSSLSKSEFIRQGNEICRKAEKERFAAMQVAARKAANSSESPISQRQQVTLAAIPSYKATAEKLSDLAPDSEREKVEAITEAMEEAADKARSNPATAGQTDIQFKKANELNEAYGLRSCVV